MSDGALKRWIWRFVVFHLFARTTRSRAFDFAVLRSAMTARLRHRTRILEEAEAKMLSLILAPKGPLFARNWQKGPVFCPEIAGICGVSVYR